MEAGSKSNAATRPRVHSAPKVCRTFHAACRRNLDGKGEASTRLGLGYQHAVTAMRPSRRTPSAQSQWTNKSVQALAQGRDPIAAVIEAARRMVTDALDSGWSGPPFDPFALAKARGISVLPRADVRDARTVPVGASHACIEYNPSRPKSRTRFSIAHEIAHTLFPDALEQVRHRAMHDGSTGDAWQLEALCNIGAAEILMPFGSLPEFSRETLTVQNLVALRDRFAVSTETVFIRAAQLSLAPCTAFSASLVADEGFKIDYAIQSQGGPRVAHRWRIPSDSAVTHCKTVDWTARGDEVWGGIGVHLECIGIPPYPGSMHPRVVGVALITAADQQPVPSISFLTGDATAIRSASPTMVAHVVNDRAHNWGGTGFAQAVRRKWPATQDDFRAWVERDETNLRLGSTQFSAPDESAFLANMVAQRGYGPTTQPRIRYSALRSCLAAVAEFALQRGLAVQMPRIGCGQAGGNWKIIQDIIETEVCRRGVPVTVFDLPGTTVANLPTQSMLNFPELE